MRYLIPAVVIAALLFYFFLPAVNIKDESVKIEVLLNNLLESGERKDIDVVMEYFSHDYIDSYGRTYPVVKKIIENAFERFDTLKGGYSDLIVSTRENNDGEEQTTANVNIWISGYRNDTPYKLLGSHGSPQNINIIFESIMFGGRKIQSVEGIN